MPSAHQVSFEAMKQSKYASKNGTHFSFAGEEIKNPEKNVPKSIMITLLIVTGIYFAVSVVMTTMVPYCILDPNTPLPQTFALNGLNWMRYVVSAGSTISLIARLD